MSNWKNYFTSGKLFQKKWPNGSPGLEVFFWQKKFWRAFALVNYLQEKLRQKDFFTLKFWSSLKRLMLSRLIQSATFCNYIWKVICFISNYRPPPNSDNNWEPIEIFYCINDHLTTTTCQKRLLFFLGLKSLYWGLTVL